MAEETETAITVLSEAVSVVESEEVREAEEAEKHSASTSLAKSIRLCWTSIYYRDKVGKQVPT